MIRGFLVALVLIVSVVQPMALGDSGDSKEVFEGTIEFGHSGTLVGAGTTEREARCDPDSSLNGLDGVWFNITDVPWAKGFEMQPDGLLDADVYFFTEDCLFIDTRRGAIYGPGRVEQGPLPQQTAFLLVNGALGRGGFELVVHDSDSFEPIEQAAYSPIQPGASIGGCTLNFVFEDAEALYIGTAGHCVSMGQRVRTPDVGNFGEVVYHELSDSLDYALIRIDDDKHQHVDPGVRFWGGPGSVESDFETGSPIHFYGQGLVVGQTEATRPRSGVLEYVKEEPFWGPKQGWYVAAGAIGPGDSGGPVLSSEGRALGTLNSVVPDDKGVVSGPTIELVLDRLDADGWNLTLVPGEYHDNEPWHGVIAAADQCLSEPFTVSGPSRSCASLLTDYSVVNPR